MIVLVTTSALAQTAAGQTNSRSSISDDLERDRVQVGVSFAPGWPVGEFRKSADPGPGLGLELTLRIGQRPFRLGVAGYFHYLSLEPAEPSVSGLSGVIRAVTDQRMTQFHGLLRVQPVTGRFNGPFCTVGGGGKGRPSDVSPT